MLRTIHFAALAVVLVAGTYALFGTRPYSLTSDIAYQGFAATQYYNHSIPTLNTVRLVSPRDLSKDVQFYLTFWSPCWAALFVLGMKCGLSLGLTARLLTLLLSLSGALGWVWVSGLIRLKGLWRAAAVTAAALYCMRTGSGYGIGTGDIGIYAVAPWLIGASIVVTGKLHDRFDTGAFWRLIVLSAAVGCLYWLKFSGIFLGVPLMGALVLEQWRVRPRPRVTRLLAATAICGVAFATPVISTKLYTEHRAGMDIAASTAGLNPVLPIKHRTALSISDTLYYASGIWFSGVTGSDSVFGGKSTWSGRLGEAAGVALFGFVAYLTAVRKPTYLRTLILLMIAVPFVGFPVLSYLTNIILEPSILHCCMPFWILLELVVFVLWMEPAKGHRHAKIGLVALAALHLALGLAVPYGTLRYAVSQWRRPQYQTGVSGLFLPDLSTVAPVKVEAQVRSLIRNPGDVIVPATYSERSFGIDAWSELDGRLLPLTIDLAPSMRTHGHDGANYFGFAPFRSTRPLRVILVSSNPYGAPTNRYSSTYVPCDYGTCLERIKSRFVQAKQWVKGPDTGGSTEIWYADLE